MFRSGISSGVSSARLHAIDHIHLDVPHGSGPRMAAFYTDVLGLPLISRRDEPDPVFIFGANKLQMRLVIRERPSVNANRRRLTIETVSLDEQLKSLKTAGVAYQRYRGIWFTDSRVLLHDPVGHLIELRQVWPL